MRSLAAQQGFFFGCEVVMKVFFIALGGAFGSLLRYYFQGWVQRSADAWSERLAGASFPIGTLAVNVTACLAIGFLGGLFAGPHLIREEYRMGLTVGVLGGYSTFSTFGFESFNLANDGEFSLAVINMLVSCAAGFAAVWLGYRMAERCFGV
jgi:CrcB protein